MTFSDWFLPSKDEMILVITNLTPGVTYGIKDSGYWTSSEVDATNAWAVDGGNPATSWELLKDNSTWVRPVRSFTGGVGDYSIGDVGPAGGWIFAYSGGRFYEAAPTDLASSYIWSSVNGAIGGDAQGTDIGLGFLNSGSIIAQHGPGGTSAAKLCYDLIIIVATTQIPTTTLITTTTLLPLQRGVTISHKSPARVTSDELVPYVVFSVNPGLGGCYEFIDMFISASFKPYSVVCALSYDGLVSDPATIVSNKIKTYNVGWYNIPKLPKTIGGKVLIGKILFVKIIFPDHDQFYDLKLTQVGYRPLLGG